MKPSVDLTEDRRFRKQRNLSKKIFTLSKTSFNNTKSDSCVLTGSASDRRSARLASEACSEDFCDRCGNFIKPWDKRKYALCPLCEKQLNEEKKMWIITI